MQTVLILQAIRDLALVHHDSSSVTMETGKLGFVTAPVYRSSATGQILRKMDIQTPLTAVYIQTVSALTPQPYPQPQPPAAPQGSATLHLAVPPHCSKDTFPFLTFQIAGGLQSQQPGLNLTSTIPVVKHKSAGKHVCPHCGRDCMKPSVLEKHLRCHTGERPYPCTTCRVSFKTQSNLYKHKRTQVHARLSSESEQSSLGSQDSLYSSSLSLESCSEEPGSQERDITETSSPSNIVQDCSVKTPVPDTGWAPVSDLASKQNESCCPVQTTKSNECMEIMNGEEEQKRMENGKSPLTPQRHLPLQRQEATLFSKQWESSVSRGKSQSHESTDSGFSESSDQYQSPSNVMPNDSMDSFTDPNGECPQQTSSSHTTAEKGHSRQEAKDGVSKQEQKTLEERITKLISENSAVVEDKQLENVRPRKTVLSKQGSIDLPMPYTYKDSFHFDMKKASNVEPQRNRKPSLYNSVPTQCATEHTSLTRSTSLPFSVTLLQTERRSPTSAYQRDYVTLPQGGSLGQISSTDFAIKSVDQQVSTHRPLVRQAAVDCNHTTEGLFVNTSVEEACSSSLSCDGDRSDICGEPSNRKCRRRKAQKFAYNKWYMYGGGTFKKLYNAEKSCDNSGFKARKSLSKPEHDVFQDQLNSVNTVAAGPNTSIVPCPMVSSDSALPAAQNVFHVHTAGLQICLQIISDEQLALIEPQIERQGHVTETSLSQGNNSEAVAPEVIPNNVYSIDMERPKEGVSPTGRAAQEEPVTRGQRGTRGQPDSPDWELKQSQDTKTDHQCLVGQEIRGVAGKDENGGMRSSEAEEVPEQWGKPESKGGRSCLSCMIKPEVCKVKAAIGEK
ncbi:zinc finger protein 831 [Lampris incognitus]|uniref:zinc finger protein 831 n=1 Tax=Lampris incognitus TaxID=2546036 RepID=UPI0024B5A1D0|nr:zinc finger protein 831 [Lampris incognitus]